MTEDVVSAVPAWLLAVVVVGGVAAAAVAAQALVRRAAPTLRAGRQNEVAGYLVAVVGVGYAVAAAFVVIALWEDYDDARAVVSQEAHTLGDVAIDAARLGAPAADEVPVLALAYAEAVRDEEWSSMVDGEESDRAVQAVDDIARSLGEVDAGGPAASAVDNVVDRLDDLRDLREERVRRAQDRVPPVLWLALLISSTVTIGFCLLFGLGSARVQYLMVAGVAAVVAVNLFQVLILAHPFSGDMGIDPEPFDHVARHIASET